MTNDELRLLWARWQGADPLSPEEQRALTSALEEDAELRDALLDDLDLDGALRGLAEGRRRADAFNRTMADIVAPERDATRFVRKVEAALAGPSQKPPSSSKLPAVRATHRFTRRARQGDHDAIAWKAGVAAALLFALVVMAAVARPKSQPVAKAPIPLPAIEEATPLPEPEGVRERERKPRAEPEPKRPPPAPERKSDRTESEPGKLEVPPPRRPEPGAPPAPAPDRSPTTAERAVALEAPKIVDGIVWRRAGSLQEFKKGDALPFDQVGSSRVDLQACKLEYSIVSPK